jgi:hypothetical protein
MANSNPFGYTGPQLDAYNQMMSGSGGNGGGGGGGSGGDSGGGGGDIFQGKTLDYLPTRPEYGNMPQMQNFPAFMPGQMEGIAAQLSQGFGAPQQSYMDQMAALYRPVGMTQLQEPLTQSMRQWGLQPSGQPGEVEKDGKFNKPKYQQYGMQTGSPWLDQMFGLKAQIPG